MSKLPNHRVIQPSDCNTRAGNLENCIINYNWNSKIHTLVVNFHTISHAEGRKEGDREGEREGGDGRAAHSRTGRVRARCASPCVCLCLCICFSFFKLTRACFYPLLLVESFEGGGTKKERW